MPVNGRFAPGAAVGVLGYARSGSIISVFHYASMITLSALVLAAFPNVS